MLKRAVWGPSGNQFFGPPTTRQKVHQTVHLSIGFLLLLAAYGTGERLLIALFPGGTGLYAIIIAYTGFAVSSFFAPFLVSLLGVRTCIVFGAILYSIFVALLSRHEMISFLVGAGLAAVASGPLYVAQDTYIARLTQDNKDTIGKYNGLFQSVSQSSVLLGSLLIALLFAFTGYHDVFSTNRDTQIPLHITITAVWVLCGVGLLGAVILFFLRPIPKSSQKRQHARQKVIAVFKALRQREMLVLMLYLFATGSMITFEVTGFGRMMRFEIFPWVMVVYGAASILSSFLVGHGLDELGPKIMISFQLVIQFAAFAFAIMAKVYNVEWVYFVCGGMFGISDALSQTLSSSMVMKDVSKYVSGGLGAYRILSSMGSVTAALMQLYLPWYVVITIMLGVFFLGAMIVIVMKRDYVQGVVRTRPIHEFEPKHSNKGISLEDSDELPRSSGSTPTETPSPSDSPRTESSFLPSEATSSTQSTGEYESSNY